MRKRRYFEYLYKFEEESKKYLIEVSLDDYNDVYDDWDPSPFKKRDIEDEFNDFVLNSTEDIPLNLKIAIVLYLPTQIKDTKKEIALISAYQNYYEYGLARLEKEITNLHKKIASYFILSILFLSIGYFFGGADSNVLLKVFHEGILIGGWVFLWEFFTSIFILRRELQEKFKLFKRLYESEIRFIYKEV
ncbi:hypothetical protein [Alkaliphilus hydrothermalis]|uniref:Uncharacterized protein n=1 Tax=Alkaliphilus hydrothermalis TaxID=1482730 RepID=A0ABS2NRY4_9FIRM|nr:hypothetical protein [Alkaliphilus hydrothermalis]MBM7615691.1 hypothetical protein [Alkaliphilus hydrothermalis]